MADQTVSSLMSLARDYHDSGRVLDAERLYTQIVEEDSGNAEAWYLRGILLYQTGRKREAIQSLEKAAGAQPGHPDILSSLGSVCADIGDYDTAIRVMREAIEAAPQDAKPYVRLGMVLLETRQFEEAIAIYQRLNELAPDAAGGWFNMGRAYEGLKRFEDAIAAYRECLARKPHLGEAYSGIAAALLDLDRPAEAIDACEQCLKRLPGDTGAIAYKAVALDALGDREAAGELLDFDRFVRVGRVEPPPGFDSVDAFNAALIDHIENHPSLSFDLEAISCHNGSTSDNLLVEPKGPVAELETLLVRAFDGYLRGVDPSQEHPFVHGAPEDWRIEMWATILERQGHQSAHIHPTGWLSGVYYVQVPEVVSDGDSDHSGWIEFGQPPDHFPAPKRPGLRYHKPEPGMFLLFPSYVYHRTVPFDSDTRRISIAFDFEPIRGG